MVAMEWVEWFARVELNWEFFMSAFCFLCNLYFAMRFAKISTFDADLKIIFVVLHLLKALLAIVHPITEIIPPEWYSIENERYIGAIIFYFLHFFHSSCFYLVAIEYALIVFERKMAVHSFYMKKKPWKGRPVLYLSIVLIVVCTLIKCIIVYYLNREHRPWKELLDKVFTIDKNLVSNAAAYIICYISGAYGVLEFIKLRKYIRKNWYASRTLEEAVKIKQTGLISKIFFPIAISYFVTATIAVSGYLFSLYLHFHFGYSLYSPYLVAFVYTQYCCVSIYNLFSTLYMIWFIGPMKKIMYDDLSHLLGIRLKNKQKVTCQEINWSEEREHHFNYLKKVWN